MKKKRFLIVIVVILLVVILIGSYIFINVKGDKEEARTFLKKIKKTHEDWEQYYGVASRVPRMQLATYVLELNKKTQALDLIYVNRDNIYCSECDLIRSNIFRYEYYANESCKYFLVPSDSLTSEKYMRKQIESKDSIAVSQNNLVKIMSQDNSFKMMLKYIKQSIK